ncbi:hypothetical protein ACWNYH_00810 [Candidatus Vidania fulgoroideorum]
MIVPINIKKIGLNVDSEVRIYMKKFKNFMLPGILNLYRRSILKCCFRFLPVYIFFKNFKHEFSFIDGVEEDILNIILNIKEVKFKLRNCDSITISVSKKGMCFLTSRDFIVRDFCEVKNPYLVIAKINYGFSISFKLTVSRFFSKRSQSNNTNNPNGISICSNRFPIKRVSFGNNKKYSFLNIKTDKTISPIICFLNSNSLILKSLNSFEKGKNKNNIFLLFDKRFIIPICNINLNIKFKNFLLFNKVKCLSELFFFYKRALVLKSKFRKNKGLVICNLAKLGFLL